ncbi:phenylalanine--tRNA ligase subunit beta [Candidatus Falkowbacteria bacterium]|nr:phenylalanine--tRNA ligase subunit beta [Candidatus Falkowbacteria bacterium]
MNISFSWLEQYMNLPADVTPKALGLKLTMATVEVESVRPLSEHLDKVVVGQIKKIEKHPNADRLKIVAVDIGGKVINVVCGGTNLRNEMFVAFAQVGAKIRWHGEGELVELKEAEVRGIKSAGMICAASELGLADIFPAKDKFEIIDLSHLNVQPGRNLSEALSLDDAVIEIDNKSLTNRPDLWGHYGLAREAAAIYDLPLNEYPLKKIKSSKEIKISVKIPEPKLCPRYMAALIKGIKVGESPDWLKQRLIAIGQKPINNIVDITNFMMFDLGQPLHAFSADKIKNNEIIVRRAKAGEKLATLDGIERKLLEEDLVIADKEKAVALAGVMGGKNSEVGKDTKMIILESANFEPVMIRKTANRLGARTEAAIRFEKSLDPNLAEVALYRAINLILELIPGSTVVSEIADVKKFSVNQNPIELTWDFIDKKIGQQIEREKISRILENLGFMLKKKKDGFSVVAPTWRATKDISVKEDIIEEITRVFGYDNLTAKMPETIIQYQSENKLRELERRVKNILALSVGANETQNYSFVDENILTKAGLRGGIELENPAAENFSRLRASLAPGLLKNIIDNLRFYEEVNLFEVGKVFIDDQAGPLARDDSKERLPTQDLMASGIIAPAKGESPFLCAKGVVETLLNYFSITRDYNLLVERPAWAHPKQCLQIIINDQPVGLVAALHPEIKKALNIKKNAGIWELNLSKIASHFPKLKEFKPLPKYPAIELDLSIIVERRVQWKDIRNLVVHSEPSFIRDVQLLDVFENDKIESGKKSVTLRITYQSAERTLRMDEVEAFLAKAMENLAKGAGAKKREV